MAYIKKGISFSREFGLTILFAIVATVCIFIWKPAYAKTRRPDVEEILKIDGITVYKVTIDDKQYIMNSQGGLIKHN